MTGSAALFDCRLQVRFVGFTGPCIALAQLTQDFLTGQLTYGSMHSSWVAPTFEATNGFLNPSHRSLGNNLFESNRQALDPNKNLS